MSAQRRRNKKKLQKLGTGNMWYNHNVRFYIQGAAKKNDPTPKM